ncbi:MAG: carbamate kinase [Methanotrichaceae archaeon]|nr:carbamate kinase [Methanotrichaceae archaeon]
MSGPTVLAFGGNALLTDASRPAFQDEVARSFAQAVSWLLPVRQGMVLVHGNGPQVGMILLRIEATKQRLPPESLDVLVAETEGSIGYLLCRALRNRIVGREIAAVLTQVVVDAGDLGFAHPSKPVGPFYSADEAGELREKQGWRMAEAPGRGWRRVVASPRPLAIVELHTIADAVGHGHLVIAGGGGGIPVVRTDENLLQGVEAVIDKDLTAALLAILLDAERFVILTDVPHVSTGFATASERRIARMNLVEAWRHLAAGEFAAGSMGPKVEAAASYAEETGRPALITNAENLEEAFWGRAGTWIWPETIMRR